MGGGSSLLLHCEACGASYSAERYLNHHQRYSCNGSKQDIREVLDTAKDLWEARKRRRTEASAKTCSSESLQVRDMSNVNSMPVLTLVPRKPSPVIDSENQVAPVHSVALVPLPELEHDLGPPIAHRKPRRERRPPKKLADAATEAELDAIEQDILPESLTSLQGELQRGHCCRYR